MDSSTEIQELKQKVATLENMVTELTKINENKKKNCDHSNLGWGGDFECNCKHRNSECYNHYANFGYFECNDCGYTP